MKRAYLKYITALLLFGTNGIVASRIELPSYQIVFWRTMIGSLLLIALFVLTGQKITFTTQKKDLFFIVISGIAMGASWIFLYEAYFQIGVSLASLLYYCGPVIVMILSPVLFKEKLTAPKIIGFLIVLSGILLLNGKIEGAVRSTWGTVCGSMSAIMYSLMVIFNKKNKSVKGFENSMIQLTVSFLTVAVFTLLTTGLHLQVTNAAWPWVAVLGLLNTGIGCYFYFSSIGRLPVQTVAICGYLEPLSAVLFALVLLKESLLPAQIAGAVLILTGAMIGYKSSAS